VSTSIQFASSVANPGDLLYYRAIILTDNLMSRLKSLPMRQQAAAFANRYELLKACAEGASKLAPPKASPVFGFKIIGPL
jgi:hypothetical protein